MRNCAQEMKGTRSTRSPQRLFAVSRLLSDATARYPHPDINMKLLARNLAQRTPDMGD
jgi:hypothetical protein